MQTMKLKYSISSQEDQLLLNEYIRQYNSVYRVAFNCLQNKSKLDVQKLNNVEKLDSWFIQSASYEAKILYNSFQQRYKEHEESREDNLKVIQQKLDNSKITRQKYKELKHSILKELKVIFGGKDNFFSRLKGNITKDQYRQSRLVPLTSYGEKSSGTKSVHGNRKFKFSEDLSYITLKLKERKIQIELPKQLHQNYKKQLIEVYRHQVQDDCPITYKIDLNYVYVTIDETELESIKYKQIQNRVLGIDMNPNYIGWSIVDWKSESEFKVVKFGIYSIKDLNDRDYSLNGQGLDSSSSERKYISNKRQYEIIQIVKNIVNKAIYYKCQIVSIEDLNIKSSDKNKGKKFNKLVNNLWNRSSFVNNLTKRCNIFNIKLLKVKSEYSSFIGNFLFRSIQLPDMVLASIELGRRGYEYYNQYISQTKQQKKNIVQPDIKLFDDFYIKSLEEFNIGREQFKDLLGLYLYFKKSKMMYRLSIDNFDLQFFRLFSIKSYVGQFINKKGILS